jgi:hypothetical protein
MRPTRTPTGRDSTSQPSSTHAHQLIGVPPRTPPWGQVIRSATGRSRNVTRLTLASVLR